MGVTASLAGAAVGVIPVAERMLTIERRQFEHTLLKVGLQRVHPLGLTLYRDERLCFCLGDDGGCITFEYAVRVGHFLSHIKRSEHGVDFNPCGY